MLFFSLKYDNTFDALTTQMFMLFMLLVHRWRRRWHGWFGPQQLEAAADDGGKDGASDEVWPTAECICVVIFFLFCGHASRVSGSKQRSVAYMETDANPINWSVASDDGMDFHMNAYLATHLVFTFSANFQMRQA